jgi:hypothetical protein
MGQDKNKMKKILTINSKKKALESWFKNKKNESF